MINFKQFFPDKYLIDTAEKIRKKAAWI